MADKNLFDSLDYYKMLEIDGNTPDEEIRAKYKELAKKWHPDHNSDPRAVDMFQKISIAYDVLKNPQTRLKYDLLSIIYNKENFPNMDALKILVNLSGRDDVNMRAFHLVEITGKGLTHSKIDSIYYCSQHEALSVVKQITKHNWLFGFWGLTAFFANISALIKNYVRIDNKKDNLMLFLHNSVAYLNANKKIEALTLAYLAKSVAPDLAIKKIDDYIKTIDGASPYLLKKWDMKKYKLAQLFYPFALIVGLGLLYSGGLMNKIEYYRKNNISVKEVVVFKDGRKSFSDVSVAKIFDIPVDVYDKSRLYYVTQKTDAKHGPDNDFDVYKTIEKGTTVRLTGQTADNKWLRVMFDNGEMAFIDSSKLKQGIGNDIPLWSKIYKEK